MDGALDSKSLCNFRLASRVQNGVTWPAFSKQCLQCLKTRYVMLQQHCLENLIQASGHHVFGPTLRDVTICIDHLTEDPKASRALWRWGDDAQRLRE